MRISKEKFEALRREYDDIARKYFYATAMTVRGRDRWEELNDSFPGMGKDALLFLLDSSLFILSMSRAWLFHDLEIEDDEVKEAKFYEAIENSVPFEGFLSRITK